MLTNEQDEALAARAGLYASDTDVTELDKAWAALQQDALINGAPGTEKLRSAISRVQTTMWAAWKVKATSLLGAENEKATFLFFLRNYSQLRMRLVESGTRVTAKDYLA